MQAKKNKKIKKIKQNKKTEPQISENLLNTAKDHG